MIPKVGDHVKVLGNAPGKNTGCIERIEGDLAYIIYGVKSLDDCALFGVGLPVAMSRLRLIE